MLKRTLLLAIALCACASAAWSQTPKIAVLDVTIPRGFDVSVVIPVTESLMEQLVGSGKYTVLDRANIEAIFKERDFQLSGEVSNDQVTEAGRFLGASFVVVSKIQLVGGAYFLSAKMIDTETAAIVIQASDSQKGDASVVIGMAQSVGAKLAGVANGGTTVKPTPKPSASPRPEPSPAASPEPRPAAEPSPLPDSSSERDTTEQKAPVFRIVADLSLPTWSGNLGTAVKGTGAALINYNNEAANPQKLDLGLELYAHLNLGEWFYLVAEYDYLAAQLKDSEFQSPSKYYDNITLENILGGFGISIPLGNFAQIYGGGLAGAGTFSIGNLWNQISYPPTLAAPSSLSKDNETGLAYALEVGACVYLAHFITVDLRYRYGGTIFGLGRSTSSATAWYKDLSDEIGSSGSSSVLDTLQYSTIAFGVGLSL